MDEKTISAVMREMGSRGGKIGGKRSLETMTPEQRSERAKRAVAAREAKRPATPKKKATGEVRARKKPSKATSDATGNS
ncbi:hypothetical protein [Bryobacter aggregatus]|uniref:hypothetical protein n=1 Tax=Bryobacter aggregatus TaxID=360054 RepID=UPI0004E1C7E7|nr:hypothetical protein [Bryobacter aggregatus]